MSHARGSASERPLRKAKIRGSPLLAAGVLAVALLTGCGEANEAPAGGTASGVEFKLNTL